MLAEFEKQLSQTLGEIKSQGLYKTERIITTPQDAHIAVAIGQRPQSAAALPIFGGLPTATARFAPRTGVVFVTRVVVAVTRPVFFVSCIENGCSFALVFEMLITSTSSLSEIAPERLTFSAR